MQYQSPGHLPFDAIRSFADKLSVCSLSSTGIGFCIALSQNDTIWCQSLTLLTNGKKAKASLTSQIASLKGARRAKAPRCWTRAGCQVLDLIIPKSELNMNSPNESNVNQGMMSLRSTNWGIWLAMRSASRSTCCRILGRYSAIAWVKSVTGDQTSRIGDGRHKPAQLL